MMILSILYHITVIPIPLNANKFKVFNKDITNQTLGNCPRRYVHLSLIINLNQYLWHHISIDFITFAQ